MSEFASDGEELMRPLLGQPFAGGDFDDPASPFFERATEVELAREINKQTVMLFMGSGVSASLGRPTWSKLVENIVKQTRALVRVDGNDVIIDESSLPWKKNKGDTLNRKRFVQQKLVRLKKLIEYIRDDAVSDNVHKIETCREVFEVVGVGVENFERLVASMFGETERAAVGSPEYEQQVKLIEKILDTTRSDRMISLNYDTEIENYFENKGVDIIRLAEGGQAKEFISSTDLARERFVSIATGSGVTGQAQAAGAAFVKLATRSLEGSRGVFHLHGVVPRKIAEGQDRPPHHSRLVVGERDYQDLYLREAPEQLLYRRLLELALRANAILFVGVGLTEEDVLRPLRLLTAELGHPSHRTFFALFTTPPPEIDSFEIMYLEEPKKLATILERAQFEQRYRLYRRYGIKVLFAQTIEQFATSMALDALAGGNIRRIDEVRSKLEPVVRDLQEFINWKPPEALREGDWMEARNWFRTACHLSACRKLDETWALWWSNWRALPKRRQPSFRRQSYRTRARVRPPMPFVAETRHQFAEPRYKHYFADIIEHQLDKLLTEISERECKSARFFRVAGRHGAGRGALVHRLIYSQRMGPSGPVGRLAKAFFCSGNEGDGNIDPPRLCTQSSY